jgi:uncharacterized FlaG/YvyC family protein
MPTNVNGVTGVSAERSPASADILAEARQRQTDRLRAAQAQNSKPTEVVEPVGKSSAAATAVTREGGLRYRVNLDANTGRLSTELLDSDTGDVILRIPPTYVDPADSLVHAERTPAEPDAQEAEEEAQS